MDKLPKFKVGEVIRIEASGQYVSIGSHPLWIEEPIDDLFRIPSVEENAYGIKKLTKWHRAMIATVAKLRQGRKKIDKGQS